jgi:hypothetical protein
LKSCWETQNQAEGSRWVTKVLDRAIVQAVSRRLPIVEAEFEPGSGRMGFVVHLLLGDRSILETSLGLLLLLLLFI